MLGVLIALQLAQAACTVAAQAQPGGAVRLRADCPAGHAAMHAGIRAALAQAADARTVRLDLGRIADYAWLSRALARQASSSRHWDTVEGRARGGSDADYVALVLRGMPEFSMLFDEWRIAQLSVEKVLLKPAAELPLPQGAPIAPQSRLPYDAIVWVTLQRP